MNQRTLLKFDHVDTYSLSHLETQPFQGNKLRTFKINPITVSPLFSLIFENFQKQCLAILNFDMTIYNFLEMNHTHILPSCRCKKM